jgi:hypothetical protein
MRPDSKQADSQLLVAAGPVAGAGAPATDAAVALPDVARLRARIALRLPRALVGPAAARIALTVLILGALAVVTVAASGPSELVPRSWWSFPNWESGPLHGLIGRPLDVPNTLGFGFSGVILVMLAAYAVVLAAARTLSMRVIVIWIVAVHAVLLLSPPLQLTDLFNYLGYARLGGLHHFNPYTHVIRQEIHDPVYRFTSWHNLKSPYGSLFTALSYPLAFLPLPLAYWTLKVVTVLLALAFLGLVGYCARQLGRDPRIAILFVAANPIYLMYGVAGFHNDFFMLVPSMAAIALLLARRDRAAGAAVMVAVAVKFTAILLLPFLLIAATPPQRRLRILVGAALATVPLAALSLALFGFSLPNLADQSTLLTDFSVPNAVGDVIGLGGGSAALLRLANVLLVVAVVLLLRRGRDWLSGAGWATLALIASLAWLVPWYVVWLLPIAALTTNVRLRRATALCTVYLVITFIPLTGIVLSKVGINPMGGSVGEASFALQEKLSQ